MLAEITSGEGDDNFWRCQCGHTEASKSGDILEVLFANSRMVARGDPCPKCGQKMTLKLRKPIYTQNVWR